ncbi:MAG TPA: hypothetical protein VML55_26765 [Planctomycetaceae bacterium]|nr:hypothetical protein [Planctomycetaceae bacterium]
MRSWFSRAALAALTAAGVCGAMHQRPAAAADGYGKVTGRFVFEGEVPEPRKIVAKGDPQVKDPQVCAAQDLFANDLVVDPESKGIANIFVYLRSVKPADVHPQLKASARKEVVFDQKSCEFIPHAMFVRTDQEVLVKSDDPVPHNTRTNPLRNRGVNFAVRANDRAGQRVTHTVAESLPTEVKCDFHPHMRAFWLILDHPYAAVTDENGEFTIDKLPAGDHEFRVWQERAYLVPLPDSPRRGTLKVTVKADEVTDLGEIKLPAAIFESE